MLAAPEDVPLLWRRIVSLMVYLYPCLGELHALQWEDVNLEHGNLHIRQSRDRVIA